MRRGPRLTAGLVAFAVALAGCTGGSHRQEVSGSAPPGASAPRGGTLRVIEPDFPPSALQQGSGLDPQKAYFSDSWELFRCCLLRTLLSYDGAPTSQGGAILHPDLAASVPTVSNDGLTWTFHLKPGLHYAPPLGHVEIKAQDIIRALEREANPKASAGGYSFYYSVIEGFDAYAAGKADSISGLEAPDDTTLRVHLVSPAGDLGERLAMPAAAPIPPNPADPAATLGVATGHDDDYGGFLVASGPYMVEGSDALDFSLPPGEQHAASGLVPGKAITLVRNPPWDPASDGIRGAYVNRIEVSVGGTLDEDAASVDQGRSDLVFYAGPPPQAPQDQVRAYQSDPAKGTVSVEPRDFLRYVSMNLAVPPFDDIHVRKAMNFVLDKARLQEIRGGPTATQVIGHVALNSLENNLLLNYDPYATPGDAGSVDQARKEMALSKYDTNGDGICDAAVCSGVVALAFNDFPIPISQSHEIRKDLAQIGIRLDLKLMPSDQVFAKLADPKNHVALALTIAWGKDYLNASNYFVPLFAAASIGSPGTSNYSLVGATPEQLRSWGYKVTEVPGVDDRINSCLVQLGEAQLRCWADLDQYLMENVVPWVPYQSDSHIQVVPRRIVRYSYDQFADLPALDQIALQVGGS
jgi:peptide/nickel transport system substrate-binding protein